MRGGEGTVPAAVGRRASPPGRPPGPALSRVLRRLGLVAAAAFAMCAAASQAQAQVLVSNTAQGYAGRVAGGRALDLAQGFTTGNDSAGYTLSAIVLRFANASPVAAPTVTVHSGTPTGPAVATLSGPGEVGAGTATFRAPASTTLTGATAYFVRVEGGGRVQLALTWGREDAGAASGWRIHDLRHYRFAHSTGSFDTADAVHAMTVSGAGKGGDPVAPPPVAKPTASDGTVTTAEDAAYAFRADDFAFSGAASGDTLASVRIVTLPAAGRLTLLGLAVSAGEAVTRADIDAGRLVFTPAANANGDSYASFTFRVGDGGEESESAYTMTVNVTAVNDPATGKPSIWGTAKVGHKLAASTGSIRDADGLPSTFTYQWIRVDGSSESNIASATSSSYTLVAADQGKTVKVKVGFTDSESNAESLTSDATDAVEAAVTEVCNPPDFGTRRSIWTGTITVGDFGGGGTVVGFSTYWGIGALDNATFTIGGSGYTVSNVTIAGQNAPSSAGQLSFLLDTSGPDIGAAHDTEFFLHVCGVSLALSDANSRDPNATYQWDTSFNWSSVTKRTLWLSIPANNAATGAPTISGNARSGQTLTAATGGIADADGLDGVTFAYEWLRVGDDGMEAVIAGAASATYTLTAGDVGTKLKVRVRFTDALDGEETLMSEAYPAAGTVRAADKVPTAKDGTVTVDEDSFYAFRAANFNFAGGESAERLRSVVVETLPAAGTFALLPAGSEVEFVDVGRRRVFINGEALIAGTTVTRAELDAGRLVVAPAANAHGDSYASFTFRVSDGLNTSESAYTMTVDVTPVNDPATGVVQITDVDGEISPANRWRVGTYFQARTSRIRDADGLPGWFFYDWVIVNADGTETGGDFIGRWYWLRNEDVGKKIRLKVSFVDKDRHWERLTSATYPRAGVTLDPPTFREFTILPRTGENTAPSAADATVTTAKNMAHVFSAADFKFSDPDQGNELWGVRIVAPPAAGALALDTTAVAASRWVTRADIEAGRLAFAPAADASGSAYASFTFKVGDGTAESAAAYTMTVDVLAGALQAEAPTVASAPGVSAAGADGAWSPGETVEVTLAFSEAVNVDAAGGTPTVGLALGGTEARSATYLRGSGTAALVFGYTLADADGAHRSMVVTLNSLALNGGTIQSTSTGADAALSHVGKVVRASPVRPRGPRDGTGGGLTARFASLPEHHDGASAFTFELHFSEAPAGLSSGTVAGGLLAVTGANVAHARQLTQGSTLGWEITAQPTQGGDIAIRLPVRACTQTHAVCASGKTLAQAVSATVTRVPLTASFAQAPAEHDGATAFELRFELSEEPADVSYVTVRDALFAVTGGSIANASRLVQGRNRGWKLNATPSGLGDVTLRVKDTTSCDTLPGVCTSDGRMLDGGLAVTVAGPAALSVADAEVAEAEGATLDFVVTLSRARTSETTVGYATSDGTATAGSDYTAASGTLTFAPGETGKTVSVTVLDDAHDEDSETMTFTLSNPSGAVLADGEATGTITNTDAMPKAWLARFGRTVAGQVLDAVESRLEAPRTAGVEASLAGQRLGGAAPGEVEARERREAEDRMTALADWVRGETSEEEGAQGFETRAVTERELLLGSSFALTGGSAETGFGALWGRAAVSGFDGRDGDLTVDGEVTSAMLGADWTGGRATAGLALAHSRGEGSYRSPGGDGEAESTLTGLYPYGRYALSERVSLWGVAGYGAGTLTLRPGEGAAIETDMALAMGALGLRGVVVEAPAEGGVELSVKTDAMAVRTTSDAARGTGGNMAGSQADVTRLRLGLQATWHGVVAGGGILTPSVEIGVRHDGGDAETGYGADIGAGIAWSDPERGLSADVRARGLLTHEADGFGERGLSGTLAWDPAPSTALGPSLTLSQTVGAAASGGAEALLGRGTLAGLPANEGATLERRHLEATLGYGLALFDGRYTGTPELGLGLSDASREYRLGWRLAEAQRTGLVFGLDVEGARRERAPGGAEHRLGLGLGWRLEGTGSERLELRLEAARLDGASDDTGNRVGVRMSARW